MRLACLLVLIGLGFGVAVAQPVPVPMPEPEAPAPSTVPTLRIPFSNTGPELDPHTIRDDNSLRAVSLVYDTLYQWVPGDQPHVEPALAAGWPEVSEDGLTVTIRLREGVNFHKHPSFGEARTRDLAASDVVHSFKRAAVFGEWWGMGWMVEGLIVGLDEYAAVDRERPEDTTTSTVVEGLTAPDELTVVLKLTRPMASLPTLLAHPCFSIMPKEALDEEIGDLDYRAIGTGPYRLQAVSDDKLYVFKRVENYWGNKPHFERVIFAYEEYWESFARGFAEDTYAEMQVFAPYLEQVWQDGKPAGLLEGSEGEMFHRGDYGYYFLAFNMDDPIFGALDEDGRKLRRAISMAFDRQAMFEADDSYDLNWVGAQENLLPKGTLHSDVADRDDYGKQDLEAAKALLEESKYKGGLDPATGNQLVLDLLSSDEPMYNQFTGALRKALGELGMKLTVRYVDSDDYRDHVRSADQQAFVAGWFLDYPDPVNFLQLFYGGNAQRDAEFNNASRYRSAAFDKLFEEYESLPPKPENTPRLRELAAAMTAEIAKDQPTVPLMWQRRAYVRSGKLEWPKAATQTFNDLRFVKPKAE